MCRECAPSKAQLVNFDTVKRVRTSLATRTRLVSLIIFGFAQLISEINFVDTVMLLSISVVLLEVGKLIAALLFPKLNSIGGLSLGVSVTISLWTIIDQLLRTTNFRASALALLAVSVVALSKVPHLKYVPLKPKQSLNDLSMAAAPVVIGLLASLLIAQIWPWLATSALCALLLLLVMTSSPNSFKNWRIAQVSLSLGGILLGALFVARSRRASDWWLPGYGIDEFEILSHAAYEFGPGMDVFVAEVTSGYQWFNFAILGLIENTSGTTDFVIASRFEAVATGFLVAMLIWGFMIEFLGNSQNAIRASIIACLVCTPMFYPSHYGLFTINNDGFQAVYLLAIPFSIVAWARNDFSGRSFILVSIVSCTYLSMKSAAIIPLGVGLITAAVMALISRRTKQIAQLCLLGFLLIGNLAITARNSSGVEVRLKNPFVFLGQYVGSNRYTDWLSRADFRLFLLYFLGFSFFLSVAGLAIVSTLRLDKTGDSAVVRNVLLSQIMIGAIFFIFGNRQSLTHLHFLQIPVTVTIIITAMLVIKKGELSLLKSTRRGRITTAVIVLIAVVPTLYAMKNSQFQLPLPSHPGLEERLALGGALASLLVGAFYLLSGLTLKPQKVNFLTLQPLFLCLVIFSSTTGVLNWWTIGSKPTLFTGVVQVQLGSSDLKTVGLWFESNTSSSDIVASNHFFAAEDPNGRYCNFTTPDQKQEYIELVKRQNYFTPVLLVKRRFAVAVPNYANLTSGADLTARITASLDHGCEPSAETRSDLKQFGVDWYLAYTPGTSLPLLPGDTVRFSVGDYSILELYSP